MLWLSMLAVMLIEPKSKWKDHRLLLVPKISTVHLSCNVCQHSTWSNFLYQIHNKCCGSDTTCSLTNCKMTWYFMSKDLKELQHNT